MNREQFKALLRKELCDEDHGPLYKSSSSGGIYPAYREDHDLTKAVNKAADRIFEKFPVGEDKESGSDHGQPCLSGY